MASLSTCHLGLWLGWQILLNLVKSLADALSRLPNPEHDRDIELNERVDGLELEAEDTSHVLIAFINFPVAKQILLREETTRCPVLNRLREVVHHGWPEYIKELPTEMRPYWSFRDELAIEDGVLFKGRQIVVPASMQRDILEQLHSR